jgi:hypothetical protein
MLSLAGKPRELLRSHSAHGFLLSVSLQDGKETVTGPFPSCAEDIICGKVQQGTGPVI